MVHENVVNENGWSLMELTLCLGIMLMLLCAAVPKAVNLDKMQVRYEAINIMNELRYVQSMTHGTDYWDYKYSTVQQARPQFWALYGKYFVQHKTKAIHYRQVSNNIKVFNNRKWYSFTKRGFSTAGTIKVKKNNELVKIIIDRVGRVRLEEG